LVEQKRFGCETSWTKVEGCYKRFKEVVLAKVRRKLKEGAWLGKRKENTLEKFITLLGSIQLGKFSVEDKKILRVQKKNPLKRVLFELFSLPSFDFIRDRKVCRV